MARPSLRRRLLALILGFTAAAWLAVGIYAYVEVRHEAAELLDAHLAQSAALILAQGDELDEIDTDHAPLLHREMRRTAFQVWERGRSLKLHSANAPDRRLSEVEEGFSDVKHDGRAWRVFSAWNPEGKLLVQVAERASARASIVQALGKALLWPLIAALPLLAAAIWLGVGRGLQPLWELRRELGRRSATDLASLDASRAPGEIAPLVAELNRLFGRIDEALQRERRLTADAAHELRTPLAALSTQAQVARRASSDATRNEALDAIVLGAERAARLAEQMLTLARLDSGQGEAAKLPVELRGLARDVLADVTPGALERRIDLSLDEGPPVIVEGHAGLLAILVRNLVDNAVRYTPEGGHVRVSASTRGKQALLEVVDDGPGVAPADLGRMGERFHRLAGQEPSGSGLGLSIVQRIAELHGGSVRYAPGPGGKGLLVTVTLPQAATA
ncbi:MAG TPA: ATP-binding protein [Myxococcota bacterium]|nr:ATP-binding protein [Myxococcota bacterium]